LESLKSGINQSRGRQEAIEFFRNLPIAAPAGMIPLLND
jgi:hypothetical protein